MMLSFKIRKLKLKDHLKILKNQLLLIFISVLAITFFTALYNLNQSKLYQAKTEIYIKKPRSSDHLVKKTLQNKKGEGSEYLKREKKILESHSMAEQILKTLNLYDREIFKGGLSPENQLLNMMEAKIKKNNNIIILSVKGEDPLLITEIANWWAKEYKYQNIQRKKQNPEEELKIPNVRIETLAVEPKKPIKPMTKKNVYIAFVISVFLGIGGAYLREFLDSTLKEASDIKNYTKFPFVGDISRINKQFYSKESGSIENDNSLLMAAEDLQKIAFLNYYFSKNKQTKTVIVTSSVPKEGKTFVSGNLGIFFAKKNETTIIVDADMRKGMLAKRFKVNSNKGLSDVILGKISLEEAIIPTSIPGLFLLCSGPYMSNPTEMLASLQLENILEKLKNKYEKIIIDSTPVLTVSESLILGPKTDGLVFIIQAHTTSIQHVHESYRILKDKVKIIGAILNKVNIKKAFIARNYFTN